MHNGSAYFSHIVLALYVIVLGMAIARSVIHVSELLKHRATVNFYGLHALWTVVLYVVLLLLAEHIWGLRCAPNWNSLHLFVVLLNPIFAFLATETLAPQFSSNQSQDLKQHYFDQAPVFYLLLALLTISESATDKFLSNSWSLTLDDAFTVFFAIGFIVLAKSKNEKLHAIVSVAALVAFLGFSLLFSTNYADLTSIERHALCK